MFYNSNSPPVNSICFVQLADYRIKPNDMGVYVKLIEYDSIEGFIPLTEISKYKTNLQKIFKPDKIYPCIVFSNDEKYVNLSFSRIKEEQRGKLIREFVYANKINNIRLLDSEKTTQSLLDPSMYDSLSVEKLYNQIVETPEKYFSGSLLEIVKSKIVFEPTEAIQKFKIIICQSDGLKKLKFALTLLQEILNKQYPDLNGHIECVSSPIYSIRINFFDEEVLKKIFTAFNESLLKNNIHSIFEESELTILKHKKFTLNV